jgi:co-chaperonin GroES (HSP10)
MTWRPAKGKLLGEILGGDRETASGIIIVQNKTQKPRKVRVLAVGAPFEDSKGVRQAYRAKPGDTAYFKLAEGQKVKINGKECLILENSDIVAVDDVISGGSRTGKSERQG